jgi:hypothetical protein
LILRFFAFFIDGRHQYRTPQKHWLNNMAKQGRKFSADYLSELTFAWQSTINRCLLIFDHAECFRRLETDRRSRAINRALMDLNMYTMARMDDARARDLRIAYRRQYIEY